MGDSSQRSERRGGMGGEVEVGVVLVEVCPGRIASSTFLLLLSSIPQLPILVHVIAQLFVAKSCLSLVSLCLMSFLS